MARRDSRIDAAVMDDFVSDARMAVYTPEVLHALKDQLHTEADRKLELWSVMYERDFHRDAEVRSRALEFDLTTFWTWYSSNLLKLEENLAHMKALTDGGRMMLGVYMYNYGEAKPLPDELMRYQLNFAERKLRSGEIEGIVLCSNCIADIGLSAVDITRDWISSLE